LLARRNKVTIVVRKETQMRNQEGPVLAPIADRADPAWLGLPEAKKAIARHRGAVFDSYDRLVRPSPNDLSLALGELGLGRTRFYALMKLWKRNRRLLDLVPHAEARGSRGEGDATVATAAAASAIVSRVLRGEADVTATGSRPFSLNMRSGEGAVAQRFGEFLVVDHTHPDLFVKQGDDELRPELTLIIDLLTTTVLGSDLHVGGPTPAAVGRALSDAVERVERLAPKSDMVSPTIMLPTDWDPAWAALTDTLGAAGAVVSARRSAKLHRGHVTMRLIGGRLDTVKLLSRRPRHDFRTAKSVQTRHAVLTLDEARVVLDAAIRNRNSRLIDGAWPSRLRLDPSRLPG